MLHLVKLLLHLLIKHAVTDVLDILDQNIWVVVRVTNLECIIRCFFVGLMEETIDLYRALCGLIHLTVVTILVKLEHIITLAEIAVTT